MLRIVYLQELFYSTELNNRSTISIFQKQLSPICVIGGLIKTKRKANQTPKPFYDFMREVTPGDVIFSFSNTHIRTGSSMIYPVIGHFDYGWRFTGSDIDPVAVKSAQAIIQANPGLRGATEVRRQKSPAHIFKGLVGVNEYFDLTQCNPPFYSSSEEAADNSERKWRGLGRGAAQAPIA
jgi:23S rRNA A1618 N6-methylase RlmF